MTRRALLLIDMQNDFCAVEGALGRRGEDLRSVQDAVTVAGHLLDVARRTDTLRILVRVVHGGRLDDGSWGSRHRGRGASHADRKAVEGEWGSEFYRLSPLSGDVVLTKTRYSAFVGTPLRQILRGARVDEVLLCGTQTDVCVLTTAFDAIQEGYDVSVVSAAVGSTRPALHEAALEIVRNRCGPVVGVDEAISLIETSD